MHTLCWASVRRLRRRSMTSSTGAPVPAFSSSWLVLCPSLASAAHQRMARLSFPAWRLGHLSRRVWSLSQVLVVLVNRPEKDGQTELVILCSARKGWPG